MTVVVLVLSVVLGALMLVAVVGACTLWDVFFDD